MKRDVVMTLAALVAISSLALIVGSAAGPPAAVVAWAGTPQSAAPNSNFPTVLQAVVRDAQGNGVQGSTVTFTAPSSGPSGTFDGSSTATASSDAVGIARASVLRANGVGGNFVVTATVSGVAGAAQFALTNTGGGGAVGPQSPFNLRIIPDAPASNVTAASGSSQAAIVNTTFSLPLQARVSDALANPVSGITVTFTAPSTGASARFSGSAVATAVSDSSGIATAPPLTANGTVGSYSVAGSASGVSTAATFSLTNSAAGPPPPPSAGTWTNVTPAGFNYNPNYPRNGDNYGFQQVLVDPVRPSDLYVFTNYQGVWKSTDFGVNWTRVNTGTNSGAINGGRNWAAVIDPNRSRNPGTPPTLYTQAGYSTVGQMGIWKSTDGGVNWTSVWTTVLAANGLTNITLQVGTDMQGLTIDPNNGQHILAVNHGNTSGGAYDHHIFETFTGGTIWIDRGNPAGSTHCAVAFVTSTTWIATAEGWGPGSRGSYVTTNSGASWTHVGQYGKAHGNVQMTYLAPNGTLYLAAMEGMYRATSPYLSWTRVDSGATQSVIGTPNYLYSSYGWASLGALAPALKRAAASNDTAWNSNYTATPGTMSNGAMGAAVTYDPAIGKSIIVTGNWLGGLWRYVE